MGYEKFPDQTGQNFPVSPQYETFPGSSVNAFESPQYESFPGGALPTPAQVIAAAGGTLLQWTEADAPGLVVDAGGSVWPDLSGNNKPWTKANATGLSIETGILDGRPVLTFNGVTAEGFMTAALDMPAPGTSPSYFYLIGVAVTWTENDALICATSAARMHIEQRTAEPGVRLGSNGITAGALNNSMIVGTPRRLVACWNNDTDNFLQIADTVTTGVNVGNNVGTGRTLCALTSGATGNANMQVYATLQYSGIDPADHAGVLAALDAYFEAKVPSVFF